MNKNNYQYVEQQKPSVDLKPVFDNDNNAILAEGFRFGNAKFTSEVEFGAEEVIYFLKERLNIKNINKNDLQIIKYKDNNNVINTRIGYYDPTIGSSFIFNKNGKFLYQMEYSKDFSGNITSCTRI